MIIGTVSAVRRNTWLDPFAMTFVVVGISLPEFVLATFLVAVFALGLHLLPVAGLDTPIHYILPSVTMAAYPCAVLSRMLRASLLEVLGQQYIVAAHAKGLSEFAVIMHHGMRNAFLPVLTALGIQVGRILGGAFVIETIFNIPGLGRVGMTAILQRDYPVILGTTILLTTAFLLTSLVVDVLYGVLDPRIRLANT